MLRHITRLHVGMLSMAVISSALVGRQVFAQNARTMTTPDENKAIVRRVTALGVNAGNLDVFRDMLSADYARHSQATTGMEEIRGRDAMLTFLRGHFGAFPDWHEEIDLMIAEGDKVAYITTGTGTHTGPMGELAPTGKRVEVISYVVQRIENGRIAETWVGWDNLAVLSQLGVFPPPGDGGK
jgi:C-1 hydroxylase